jgi:hypothetical protein
MNNSICYLRVFIDWQGKPRVSKVRRTYESLASEIFHFNIKSAEKLIAKWNAYGQDKYRYVLLSENVGL